MKAIQSSTIAAYDYDNATRVLSVQFKSGKAIYRYADVPPEVARELEAAGSFGSYFHANVKGKFQFTKEEPKHE